MRIGFIGLGIMGKPMAKNLVRAGHTLVVSNHNAAAAAELTALGATAAQTPREIAAQTDLVVTMLPNSPHVRAVALGSGGHDGQDVHDGIVACGSTPLVVDMSSIAPLVAREVAAELAAVGIPMLDAPVSGGEPKAVDGTLSIMVGGDPDVFERARPVLEVMGSSVVRVGDVGAGNTAKLANQVVVAVNIAALSEALVLAQKAGVAPAAVVSAIRGGLAGSAVLDAKADLMLDHELRPGFRIALHVKDLLNALGTGHDVAAPLPLTAAVLEMFTALQAAGHDGDDHSGLVRHYEQLAQTQLSR